MPAQVYSWTCSACAQDWVLRAVGVMDSDDIYYTREKVVEAIGYPHNINPMYGLMDGSGTELMRVYDSLGVKTEQGWLDFDTVYDLAQQTTGQMSGAAYYHWVALRGVQGPNLWIANSAPGYKGIWDTLSRDDWDRLGGWSVVWLVE